MRLGFAYWVIICATGVAAYGQTTNAPDAQATSKPSDTAPGAQPPAPNPAPAPPAPAPSIWSVGPIDFSGLVDGYYNENFNHPASGNNQLRNFDLKANQFTLNMAKVSLSHTADPVGFQVDFGFGRAFDLIHSSERAPQVFQYLEQVYISLKPNHMHGTEIDFGEFVTTAGAEVIETKDNFNYSRSLLFAYGIPYYHFGLRTSTPLTKSLSVGFQVVNGWNNVEDNNTGKTVGFNVVFSKPKFTWTNDYYGGPEKTDTNKGFRQLYDTTLVLNPTDKVSAYINFDYGRDKRLTSGADHWEGVAFALKVSPTSWFALSPRIETFDDANGFSTGTKQQLWEVTMTAEFKMKEGFLSRLEYRHDHSDMLFFDRGATPAASHNMNTLEAGFVAFFGPKR